MRSFRSSDTNDRIPDYKHIHHSDDIDKGYDDDDSDNDNDDILLCPITPDDLTKAPIGTREEKKKLECRAAVSTGRLFESREGALMLNHEALKGEKLERCVYRTITYRTDHMHVYSHRHVKKDEFDVVVQKDFVRVQCFLQKSNIHANKEVGNAQQIAQEMEGENFEKNDMQPHIFTTVLESDQNVNLENEQNVDLGQGEFRQNDVNEINHNQNVNLVQDVLKQNDANVNNLDQKVNLEQNAFKQNDANANNQDLQKVNFDEEVFRKNEVHANIQDQDLNQIPGEDHIADNMYRESVHLNSPRLVGSVGMPDFPDSLYKVDKENSKARSIVKRDVIGHETSEDQEILNLKLLNDQNADEHAQGIQADNPEGTEQPSSQENVAKSDNEQKNSNDKEINEASEEEAGWEAFADFDEFHVQIAEKEDVKKRLKELSSSRTNSSSNLDVLIIMLDSVSRKIFHEDMKTSVAVLERIGAIEMYGYNVLGDAAAAAVIPLLTGQKESGLHDMHVSGDTAQYIDALPYIWNKFEQTGYVTMYAEDQPDLGTFQTLFHGFENPPVDHYMRPFWIAAANYKQPSSDPLCLGTVAKHRYMLDYVEKFYRAYKDERKIAFLSLSEFNADEVFDEDFSRFVTGLQNSKVLDNTVLILLGDHGPSHGEDRMTRIGQLQERRPYLSFTLPVLFKEKYPSLVLNLQDNAKKLTTALDVHQTLKTLLDLNLEQSASANERAYNLFTLIPRHRTCHTAGINMHWCTCTKYDIISEESSTETTSLIGQLAELSVRHINTLLEADEQCVKLRLSEVKHAYNIIDNDQIYTIERRLPPGDLFVNWTSLHPDVVHYYRITFETAPNRGVFETTVEHRASSGSSSVLGDISRVNSYGRESECIMEKHPQLRKYCACRS